MIIIICGGIGSGKSLTTIRQLVLRDNMTFCNFNTKGMKAERIKMSDIICERQKEDSKGKARAYKAVNFDIWNERLKELKGYDIALDEFHNLMNSRRAMSTNSVLMSDFLAQIRKIMGSSEKNNLYLITQKLRRIDVNSRDLAHHVILCEKVEYNHIRINTKINDNGRLITRKMPLMVCINRHFDSCEAASMFTMTNDRRYIKNITYFVGNSYYRYYDSYELISFGGDEYL